MAAIAELRAIGTLDGKQFEMEVTKLGNSVQKLGSNQLAGLKGMIAGAFSAGAIISFGKNLLETAHQMEIIAEATNLTMGQLVALKSVAAENGMNMDVLSMALGRVRDAQGQAVALSPQMIEALAALNINAREFIGAGTDEALAMVAKGFVDAGGSAEAFSAVKDILGKGSKDMIEMLKALDAEGLAPLAKRTEDATKGFEALAAAKGNIEKFWNAVQIGAGTAAGKIMEVAAAMGELSVKQEQAGKTRGILSTMFEAMGSAFYKGKFGEDILTDPTKKGRGGPAAAGVAGPGKVGIPNAADVSAFEENMRKAKEKAMALDLKSDNARQKREDDFYRKEEELVTHFADKRKDILGVAGPAASRVDALQAIGGLIGGAGGGDAASRAAERQARAAEAMQDLMRETNTKLRELRDAFDQLAEE